MPQWWFPTTPPCKTSISFPILTSLIYGKSFAMNEDPKELPFGLQSTAPVSASKTHAVDESLSTEGMASKFGCLPVHSNDFCTSVDLSSRGDLERASVSELDGKGHERFATPGSLIRSFVVSSLTSLAIVVALLLLVRLLLPSAVEQTRYAWYRGQLKAEYEMAGKILTQTSYENIASVSQAVGKRVSPSVVQLLSILPSSSSKSENVSTEESWDRFQRNDEDKPSVRPESATGHGSGVIVDGEGHILTNSHVVDPASDILVQLADRRLIPAKVIARDAATDLALLKIEADNLFPIDWGDSDALQLGSPVWALGSPFGLQGSLTFGIVSSKNRLNLGGTYYESPSRRGSNRWWGGDQGPIPRYSDLIQTDVAVNPGNSGGPLVNARGELVGINTAIVGESYRGVSFAIPSKVAQRVVAEIKKHGEVRRGWLGVELVSMEAFSSKNKLSKSQYEGSHSSTRFSASDGTLFPARFKPTVQRIVKDSPASTGGLQIGDVLLGIGDDVFSTVDEAIFKIGEVTPGQTLSLKILRGDEDVELPITLGKRPD